LAGAGFSAFAGAAPLAGAAAGLSAGSFRRRHLLYALDRGLRELLQALRGEFPPRRLVADLWRVQRAGRVTGAAYRVDDFLAALRDHGRVGIGDGHVAHGLEAFGDFLVRHRGLVGEIEAHHEVGEHPEERDRDDEREDDDHDQLRGRLDRARMFFDVGVLGHRRLGWSARDYIVKP
jgi:hypothetical protein